MALLTDDGSRFLTVHQSPAEPPNFTRARMSTASGISGRKVATLATYWMPLSPTKAARAAHTTHRT